MKLFSKKYKRRKEKKTHNIINFDWKTNTHFIHTYIQLLRSAHTHNYFMVALEMRTLLNCIFMWEVTRINNIIIVDWPATDGRADVFIYRGEWMIFKTVSGFCTLHWTATGFYSLLPGRIYSRFFFYPLVFKVSVTRVEM